MKAKDVGGQAMKLYQYNVELRRTDGRTVCTTMTLSSLTKGQRVKVPVDEGVNAEVIEVVGRASDKFGGGRDLTRMHGHTAIVRELEF
jgi:hypothetical protein